MMLKVLTYGYIEKIYTSQNNSKSSEREHILYVVKWHEHSGFYHDTTTFRSKRLKESVDDVFSSVVEVLIQGGYVKAENFFIDGTKIEANANRYSYVWKKNVERT